MRHSVFTFNESDGLVFSDHYFNPGIYSRFKHGCRNSSIYLGQLLAEFIKNSIELPKEITVTSSAYSQVPTASELLLGSTLRHQNWGTMVNTTHLSRRGIIPLDYAKLNPVQRKYAMKRVKINFDPSAIMEKTVLVIDDAYVTGTHENLIYEHLAPYARELVFVYLVDASKTDFRGVESHLNNFVVKSLTDLQPIIAQPDFRLNSRVLKMIFGAPTGEFRRLMDWTSLDFQISVYRAAKANRYYDLDPKFRRRLSYIQRLISTPALAA